MRNGNRYGENWLLKNLKERFFTTIGVAVGVTIPFYITNIYSNPLQLLLLFVSSYLIANISGLIWLYATEKRKDKNNETDL